jgi:glutamyl-tRNA reductase
MSLFVFGANHKTAPVAIRERLSFAPERLSGALKTFAGQPGVREVAILSTCNRTEVYCHLDSALSEEPLRVFGDYQGVEWAALQPYLFAYRGEETVRHLLRVASGLDSLVLGEPQILGQLKSAFQTASEAGTIGKFLNKAFQHAFSVAKQVRTDTAIGSSPVSVAFAAVRLARQIFGDLGAQTVLLIGAGDTIELTAQHLHDHGVRRMIVANRTVERSQILAGRFGAYAIPLSSMPQHLAEADIVISATASQLPILGKGAVERALKARKHKPMFMVDIAMPRDIEPEIGELEDVYLYTVDDLEAVIQESLHSRRLAALQAEDIIATEVEHFMDWLHSLDAVSTIRALRGKARDAQKQVIARAQRRLAKGDDQAEVLEQLTTQLVNKLVHHPSVKLREASAAGRDELLRAAAELFDLGQPIPKGK